MRGAVGWARSHQATLLCTLCVLSEAPRPWTSTRKKYLSRRPSCLELLRCLGLRSMSSVPQVVFALESCVRGQRRPFGARAADATKGSRSTPSLHCLLLRSFFVVMYRTWFFEQRVDRTVFA